MAKKLMKKKLRKYWVLVKEISLLDGNYHILDGGARHTSKKSAIENWESMDEEEKKQVCIVKMLAFDFGE